MDLFSFFHKHKFRILLILLLTFFQQTGFSQPALLDPVTHPKFVNDIPVIKDLGLRIDLTKGKPKVVSVQMRETFQDLGLVDAASNPLTTRVWGYKFPGLPTTYPGATIIAMKDVPLQFKWHNKLPAHFLPVDPSLHMAHPDYLHDIESVKSWYNAGNVPTVTHLHGGHTESASDGLPEAWFTQNFKENGQYFVKKTYKYDNDQEAATLWYHDHALGITRLNVYAGLAGFYLLRDENELSLIEDGVLPGDDYEIEMVIQDRSFYNNGELFWPANPNEPSNNIWNPWEEFIEGEGVDENPLFNQVFPNGGPTALAEFFGDFILVNGKAWPKLDVEPRKYRFRLLNGSDSRFYVLEFRDDETGGTAQSFLQIGSDDGLLEEPVSLTQLVIAPGERMDVVVDFSGFTTGSNIYLRNFGPDSPFGGLPVEPEDIADEETTGQIMRFDVTKTLNEDIPIASVSTGTTLNSIASLGTGTVTRKLGLFEGTDEYGRLQPLLGGEIGGNIESLTWNDAITENPDLGAVEEWEVYNFTGDAHPVHLHLVAFQIIDRAPITDYESETKAQLQHNGLYGNGEIVDLSSITTGASEAPSENEKGWKDTFIVPPGYVGRVVAKFDRPGRYVWHCHILSHEDHEMMRPYHVGALPKQLASNEINAVNEYSLEQNYPNPFNPSTAINFSIPNENTPVSLKIFNSLGQEVSTLLDQIVPAGNHEVQFDASGLSSGIYFYTLRTGDFVDSKKMLLIK